MIPLTVECQQLPVFRIFAGTTRFTTGKEGDKGKGEVGPNAYAKRTDGKDSVGPGVYAMWVEFGLKKKKFPKQPFMRPTFDATAEQATKLFADKLKDDLEAVVKE